jgi:hypothetical protein
MFDFNRAWQQTEDFLRRHIKPKAVVEAEKRRGRRRSRDAMLRLTRAASVSGASGVGILGYGLAVAPIGTPGLIAAGAATAVAAGVALLWPRRSPVEGKISRAELIALIGEAEEWLLAQRKQAPGRVIPILDMIIGRLGDLNPHVGALDPFGTLAWELRRLLTDHLPRLIQSYGGLPATVRDQDPQLLQRLIGSLRTLDEELVRICKEASRDHLLTFEVRDRFIQSRYKDGDSLSGE